MRRNNFLRLGLTLALVVVGSAGCSRKKAVKNVPPVPAPQAAPAPTVALSATPASIERGQQTTLKWSSNNAATLTLEPGLGRVEPSGTMNLSPHDSLTYRIVAQGAGGNAEASARVTVTAPVASAPPPEPASEDPTSAFNRAVQDIHFDYDKYDINGDAIPVLQRDADFLRTHPQVHLILEGHCDERGSEEYNLALGDRRANAARQYLVSLGIDAGRLRTLSYGKEKPVCTESDEACWRRNRRGHPALAR